MADPVTWIGALIATGDRRLNRPGTARRARGTVLALGVIAVAALAGWVVQRLAGGGWAGTLICGVAAWPLLAVRSMHDHVRAVAEPLAAGDLPGARNAVSMIVGRDPRSLDEAGVARAAVESLAENTSDGIVAPLFWGVVAGLPGIAAYKAANTLDSMIGHRTTRHEDFGWAAARIDDVLNLIPARLTGAVFAVVSGRAGAAWACMLRDARHHRSPNGGWPEAAMAGALDVRLSGPRRYGETQVDEPWVNAGRPDPGAADLHGALAVYRRSMGAMALGLALLAAL